MSAKRKRKAKLTVHVIGDPFNAQAPRQRSRAAKRRGMNADAAAEKALATWKSAYIASKRAELEVTLAKSVVRGILSANEADYIVSKVGTIALKQYAPIVDTDWEALARALIPAAKLERALPKYTSTSPAPAPVLAAPSGWTAEAGC